MEGICYNFFVADMPYPTFGMMYLLGEVHGADPQVIYNRYAAIGDNPSHIRGRHYLEIHAVELFGNGLRRRLRQRWRESRRREPQSRQFKERFKLKFLLKVLMR